MIKVEPCAICSVKYMVTDEDGDEYDTALIYIDETTLDIVVSTETPFIN
jgi:hypothetical protein